MQKEQAINYIKNAMSLRTPQEKSLVLFADYLESEAGKALLNKMLKAERKPIDELESRAVGHFSGIPEGQKFEGFDGRAYPTFTYALATGVGKTRLMGAFVTYLYLVHGIQHFMIVAPGNTIYRKLVDDFSKPNNPKYVFKGIEELNTSTIKIITKDDYLQSQNLNLGLYKNKIEINILNVQQFAQKDIDKQKGITKGSENFGVQDGKLLSYFDYLAELNDLVVLLDESHHYHADAAFQSLDRLAPLIGLEFTATPYTGVYEGRGAQRQQVMKESIVYLYNLGDAIRDKYVKDPWVGTEADVNFKQFDSESIESDLRKLQLAVYFHERAKTAIKEYALENNVRIVKPVMLVVAQNIAHAEELKQKIDSADFRGGEYKGKVLVVHTNQSGEESDLSIEQLVSLEDPDNYIEVVIHVNMLKEGWDVANIYTIVPLRSSAAQILTEQTIGRGLRLPYGDRTGVPLVDRVVVVAHEQYSKVIEQAQNSSLIQPTNIESVTRDQEKEIKIILEAKPVHIERIEESLKENQILQSELQQKAEQDLSHSFNTETPEDIKQKAIEIRVSEYNTEIAKMTADTGSFSVFHSQKDEVEKGFDPGSLFSSLSEESKQQVNIIKSEAMKTIELRNIPISRLSLTPQYGSLSFNDFDFDISMLEKYKIDISVMETRLQNEQNTTLFGEQKLAGQQVEISKIESFGGVRNQKPENTLVAALMNEPLVDYEEQKALLVKLSSQAVSYYKTFTQDESNLLLLIETYAREISKVIYNQMLNHKNSEDGYIESTIGEPKSALDQHNISHIEGELAVTLDSQLNTFSKQKIYNGFKQACHSYYKFDSSDEARLAYLLDRDSLVEDWLRPAPNQFEGLYWRDEQGESHHKYEPDFIVELEKEIVMIEVKPQIEINDFDVQAKKQTAEKYCEVVNKNIGKLGIIKSWKYVIIPTDKITISSTVTNLLR